MRTVLALAIAAACSTATCRKSPRSAPPRIPPGGGDGGGGGAASSDGRITGLFAGGQHTCVLRGGEVRCWGSGHDGALGPGVTGSSTTVPTAIPGLEGAVEVVLGQSHGCARIKDGSVRCWGGSDYGATGTGQDSGEQPKPARVEVSGVSQLAAGGYHTCALSAGRVWCWGRDFGNKPQLVPGVDAVQQVVAGERHVCARVADGVRCWGHNDHGQLGSAAAGQHRDAPGAVPGLGAVDELAAAGDYTCARKGSKVWCWGAGDDAQLGDVARTDNPTPRAVEGVGDAAALALGQHHACALLGDRSVTCWGGADYHAFGFPQNCPENRRAQRTSSGQMAIMTLYCAAPVQVPGLSDVTTLVHGFDHACYLDRSGAVSCWGGSGAGELGNREHGSGGSKTPIAVAFPGPRPPSRAHARAVAVAEGWSCAVLDDGSVKCWGSSAMDQIIGVDTSTATPATIPGLTGVVDVALGRHYACALLGDGGVRCWGWSDVGAHGAQGHLYQPTAIAGLPPAVALSASLQADDGHTCALTKDGEAWCWGGNSNGESRASGSSKRELTPARVATGASQVVAGDGATCVRSKGDLKCWGNAPAVPAAIAGKVAEVGLGHDIHCARLDGGEVTCWGGKATGTVAVGAPARALAVAPYQGAAVRADGKVMFWWLESTTPPKQVSLVDPARVMCAGHCCALGKDGSVLCWGDNLMGQLGNPDQGLGGSTEVPTPVAL